MKETKGIYQVNINTSGFVYLQSIKALRKVIQAALWVVERKGRLTTSYRRVKRMARATVLKTTEHFPLTTIEATEEDPEGGWVELRRLSYGEKLHKDAEAMKMRFAMDTGSTKNMDAEVSLINEVVTLLEFAKCIIDHNLTDENGKKLDFRKQLDVQSLDPRVGDEISTLIGEMNDFEKASKTSPGFDSSGK